MYTVLQLTSHHTTLTKITQFFRLITKKKTLTKLYKPGAYYRNFTVLFHVTNIFKAEIVQKNKNAQLQLKN